MEFGFMSFIVKGLEPVPIYNGFHKHVYEHKQKSKKLEFL